MDQQSTLFLLLDQPFLKSEKWGDFVDFKKFYSQ